MPRGSVDAPSVGRFHGRLRTSVTPTCADSASPGLAAVSRRRPRRTEAIPNARGFRVFPSARRPSERRPPRASRRWSATSSVAVYFSHRTTHWTLRSGLPCGRHCVVQRALGTAISKRPKSGSLPAGHRLRFHPASNFPRSVNTGRKSFLEILQTRIRICVPLGEPNYFSPNPNARLVDTTALSATAVVPQDIPNCRHTFPDDPVLLFPPRRTVVIGSVSPLRRATARLLLLPEERPLAVNAANVSVSTFRTPCVCLQRSVSRTL